MPRGVDIGSKNWPLSYEATEKMRNIEILIFTDHHVHVHM
jgi:hypothetical protein